MASAVGGTVARQMDAEDLATGMSDKLAEPVPEAEWTLLEREGRELCQRLRADLGDGWIVDWEGI